MKIIHFNNHFLESWDHFVLNNPYSTIYHDSVWMKIVQETFAYKQKGFLLVDGEKILGGLPLFEVKGFSGKRLVSSPFRDRGGALVQDNVDLSLLILEAIKISIDENFKYLLIKEENNYNSDQINNLGLIEHKYWITTIIDLSKGSDFIWKKLKNNAKGPVKQAEKFGVQVVFAEEENDMKDFYNIFIKCRRKIGIPSFSLQFFKEIFHKLCKNNKAKLLLAKDAKNIPVAGIILLIHKNTVIDGYAASLQQFMDLRANDLLLWSSIKWAADSGYKIFDFGADSPNQKGLLSFKKKWNGTHRHVYQYFYPNGCNLDFKNFDSSSSSHKISRKMLSYLPIPCFKLIGKYFVPKLG